MNEHRAMALILRLVACELAGEARGATVLRRVLLQDLGWTEGAIDRAATRVRAAVYVQAELFERAA